MARGEFAVPEGTVGDFAGFDSMYTSSDGNVSFRFSVGNSAGLDMKDVRRDIEERIAARQMPAGKLCKALDRITLHVDQLQGALSKLFDVYGRMVAPKGSRPRVGAVSKIQRALVERMSDKLLRLYASEHMDVGDYILPDDREALVDELCIILATNRPEAVESVS